MKVLLPSVKHITYLQYEVVEIFTAGCWCVSVNKNNIEQRCKFISEQQINVGTAAVFRQAACYVCPVYNLHFWIRTQDAF